jgi:dTDP-4-dehydrorhamnose 3,5-epimerase
MGELERIDTELPGVFLIEHRVFGDARGWFFEGYHARDFEAIGVRRVFVQDNLSRSARGVLRGLHYQLTRPQAKLVRVIAGEVLDVAVDVRRGSPFFGRWASAVLSAENKRAMFIPEGFAHGFYLLSESADFLYKCSDYYAPSDERGVLWSDPAIGVRWGIAPGSEPLLSAKDRLFGTLATRPPEDLPVYREGT